MSVAQARPAGVAHRAWQPPEAVPAVVGSGLRVLAVTLPAQPIACAVVTVAARPDLEPVDGVAALLNALLAQGTARRDADAFADDLERLGATLRPLPSLDGVRLRLIAPADRIGAALRLVAESLAEPRLVPADVERLRGVALAELATDRAAADVRAQLAFRAAVFAPGSRQARRLGGDEESLSRADAELLAAFAGEHLAADRTTVTLVSGLSPERAVAAVAEAFAGWAVRAGDPAPVPAPVAPEGTRLVVADRPGSPQSYVVVGRAAFDRSHPDWAALRLGTHVLGGSLTARLDSVLREERGYTYGFRTLATPFARGGTWLGRGGVHTEVTADATGCALGLLAAFADEGPTADELARAKSYLLGSLPVRMQTADVLATEVATHAGAGLGPGWLARHLAALATTTGDEVAEAVARHLRREAMTVVVVGDAERVAGPLGALGIGAP